MFDELDLIDTIRQSVPTASERLSVGIGDDAAVVKGAKSTVLSVDSSVAGVHFELGAMTLEDIGYRALARALSDIAAMGSRPGEAYLALVLPAGFEQTDLRRLANGVGVAATEFGVAVAGGDLTKGEQLALSVTVTGWFESGERPVLRSGAKPGDLVGVTGSLGGSGAGLAVLRRLANGGGELVDRYRRPSPRIEEGRKLASAGVSAMIDLSDGLAADLPRLALASKVSVDVDLDRLPVQAGVESVAAKLGVNPALFVATAGEDYELCFCIPQRSAIGADLADRIAWIGTVSESANDGSVRFLRNGMPVVVEGYDHFKRR